MGMCAWLHGPGGAGLWLSCASSRWSRSRGAIPRQASGRDRSALSSAIRPGHGAVQARCWFSLTGCGVWSWHDLRCRPRARLRISCGLCRGAVLVIHWYPAPGIPAIREGGSGESGPGHLMQPSSEGLAGTECHPVLQRRGTNTLIRSLAHQYLYR